MKVKTKKENEKRNIKIGDLVKSSKDTSLSASVGIVVESWGKLGQP